MTKEKKKPVNKAGKKIEEILKATASELSKAMKDTVKVVKTYKAKKEWLEVAAEVDKLFKESDELHEKAMKMREKFWKMVEKDVKFTKKDRKESKKLHFISEKKVVELVQITMPDIPCSGCIELGHKH